MNPKTAIVTGAAQGVSAACATRLLQGNTTRMLLIDRDADMMATTAYDLRGQGADVDTIVLDLSDADTLLRDIGAAIGRFERIDTLVNAAGTTARGGLKDTTPDLFDTIFRINVRTPLLVMRIVAPAMRPAGGPPFIATYAASKAALFALGRNTANALKGDRIRVHATTLARRGHRASSATRPRFTVCPNTGARLWVRPSHSRKCSCLPTVRLSQHFPPRTLRR